MEGMMLPQKPSARSVSRNRLGKAKPAPTVSMDLNASSFWLRDGAHLTCSLQQGQPFRKDDQPRVEVVFRPSDDGESYALYRIAPGERKWQALYVPVEGSLNHRIPDDALSGRDGVIPWAAETDLTSAIESQSEAMELDAERFAISFARALLPESTQGWRWHPVLGFSRKE